jgi:hypothetical protein
VAGCCECGDEPSGSGATELGNFHDISFIKTVTVIGIEILNFLSFFIKFMKVFSYESVHGNKENNCESNQPSNQP